MYKQGKSILIKNHSEVKLPPLVSPQEKLIKSKQFYNYLQNEMEKEYGIDINRGIIKNKDT